MPRVKRGTKRRAKRKKILGRASGYFLTKSKLYRSAKEAVDRALSQAESLERAMKTVEIGVRQQQENEKTLRKLNEALTSLNSQHETVLERSSEISQLQRDTENQVKATRQDLGVLVDQTATQMGEDGRERAHSGLHWSRSTWRKVKRFILSQSARTSARSAPRSFSRPRQTNGSVRKST